MNKLITEGIQAQVGEEKNFEPKAQIQDLGNDDQAFWAFTVMDAAELGFPDPPKDQPSWLGLAQAVFNRQTEKWDPTQCKGGMRWQKFPFNPGWDYKNLPSNGGYFHLAARLARYTGNNTYVDYANRMWDWIENGPMWQNKTDGLYLYDGIHVENCDKHDPGEWTYNVGQLLSGASYLYDYSSDNSTKQLWHDRIDVLMKNTDRWFYKTAGTNDANKPPPGGGQIMAEAACEFVQPQKCNQDQPSFKGFTTRWFAMTSVLAPWTNATIYPRMLATAQAVATQCVGTADNQIPGTSCGRRWYQTRWDGYSGVGEQMSAASAFQNLLIANAKKPVTAKKGGTSKSDPGLGNDDGQGTGQPAIYTRKITTGDKAGAAILTILGLGMALGGGAWMVIGS
ncbi:MAG: hydrolase 76 protein [Stictis urceolatum]|nr:hydrolase 76 protein [Stictis urceolata]